MQVVCYDWLPDSIDAGKPLPPADYKTDRHRRQGILTAAQLNAKPPPTGVQVAPRQHDASVGTHAAKHYAGRTSENVAPQKRGHATASEPASIQPARQHNHAAAGNASGPDHSANGFTFRAQQPAPHHSTAGPSQQSDFSFGMQPAARMTHMQPSSRPTISVPQPKLPTPGAGSSDPDTPRLRLGLPTAQAAGTAAEAAHASGTVIGDPRVLPHDQLAAGPSLAGSPAASPQHEEAGSCGVGQADAGAAAQPMAVSPVVSARPAASVQPIPASPGSWSEEEDDDDCIIPGMTHAKQVLTHHTHLIPSCASGSAAQRTFAAILATQALSL